jgi:hypothetical protein
MVQKNRNGLKKARIVVNLNRGEFEFIDKLGRDALFTTGRRLTNNKILRTFVNVMQELKIDGNGLRSPSELKERLLMALGIKKDRRKYLRFKEDVQVSYRKLDSMTKHTKAQTIDISQHGFRIELNDKRKVGEVLEFIIHDPQMPDKPINAFGRIVWIRGNEAGIKLTSFPEEDKQRFAKLFCGQGDIVMLQ